MAITVTNACFPQHFQESLNGFNWADFSGKQHIPANANVHIGGVSSLGHNTKNGKPVFSKSCLGFAFRVPLQKYSSNHGLYIEIDFSSQVQPGSLQQSV